MTEIILQIFKQQSATIDSTHDCWYNMLNSIDIYETEWYWRRFSARSEYAEEINEEIQNAVSKFSATYDPDNEVLIFESEADKFEFLITFG